MRRNRIIFLAVVTFAVLLTGCKSNPSEEGVLFLQEGQYEEAIVKFQEAVDENVNAGDAYRGIGIAKWELQDYAGALEAFENAMDNGVTPTATLYNFLGTCELKLNDYKMAINYYRLGMVCEDCSEEMLQEMRFNEIVCFEALEDWENAKAKLAEYAADYPGDPIAAKEAEFFETR